MVNRLTEGRQPVAGTPAEAYFHGRLKGQIPSNVYWVPRGDLPSYMKGWKPPPEDAAGCVLYPYQKGAAIVGYGIEGLTPAGKKTDPRHRVTAGSCKDAIYDAGGEGAHAIVTEGEVSALASRQLWPDTRCHAALSAGLLKDWNAPEGVTRVTIVAEQEEVAEKGAFDLKRKLLAQGLTVEIRRFPAGDAADALLAGGEADSAELLTDDPSKPLGEWMKTPTPEPVLWMDRGKDKDKHPWPLVSVGEPGILSAPGGSGKSYVALEIAYQAAAATERGSALGLAVRPGPALLVAYEDRPARLAARIKAMHPGVDAPEGLRVMPDPGPLWQGDPKERGKITPGPGWDPLLTACHEHHPSLVILDPAGEVLVDVDSAQGSAVRTLYQELAKLPGDPGVLIVAHDTKAARNEARAGGNPGAGAIAGSAAWFDRARGAAYLHTLRQRRERVLEIIKSNHGPTGWGALLAEKLENEGEKDERFCGFGLAGVLEPGEPRAHLDAYHGELEAAAKDRRKAQKQEPGETSQPVGNGRASHYDTPPDEMNALVDKVIKEGH